ncbi:MAG TPA: helix-turn-helix transcriptional regulator [Candidatus Faecimonas intestinavium]|nr:helix-turn-helix transcriptional regulator [Candidatus Faecimonas intestinavium]
MNYSKIGLRIAEARVKHDLTQEELAEKIGKTSQFISNIETGKRKPSLSTLLNIAKVLNLSLDYLIYDNDIEEKIRDDIYMKQIYKQLESLDDEKRNKLLDIVEYISKKI